MEDSKLIECLENRYGNYIFPFFWQHGEDDETLIREINAIHESGIKALCVEARPFEEFCEDPWWHTMGLILDKCKELGMKVWLLDDKHFPSGYANGIVSKKYPDERMWSLTEKHFDIIGPMKDAAIIADWKFEDSDQLVGIVAYKRLPHSDTLTGEPIVLTDKLSDGMVYFDAPEGCYRIFIIYKTHHGYSEWNFEYCDKLTEKGGDMFIEAVYQPHYEHFKEYFGNTFAGFFSDEPCFKNNTDNNLRPFPGVKYSHFPYTDEVLAELTKKFGGKTVAMLPSMWFDTDDATARTMRVAYMDVITMMYSKYFTYKLGDWCRAHGVEYIGHIIEDDHQHLATKDSAGHFFRALDGEDMAGIDVVLNQVMPGLEDYTHAVPCNYEIADADFFHFMLPKLGASHAHIQAEKKNRAMCEIFGAFGWAEGLKFMKWLTDFMMVRGINQFVPHAFSPKFPDEDCPPHFYAGGTNPQFKDFKLLMEYMNRISHIQNDGRQVVSAGVLYYAEAAWSGCKFMRTDAVVRYLTEHQLDCDVMPTDYLQKADIKDGKLYSGNSVCPCFILPYAEYQPKVILDLIEEFSAKGLPVFIIDSAPGCMEDGTVWSVPAGVNIIPMDELENSIRTLCFGDVTPVNEARSLRFCHNVHGSADYYFITNEAKYETVETALSFSSFNGGKYIEYNAMDNTAVTKVSPDGKVNVKLEPYGSVVFVFGEETETIPAYTEYNFVSESAVDDCWNIYTAELNSGDYKLYKQNSPLFNITGAKGMPRFAGHIRYEKEIEIPGDASGKSLILDLGTVGESVTLYIDGNKIGTKIVPPYRFDISQYADKNKVNVMLECTTHYGYYFRDDLSAYHLLEPSGIQGPVKLQKFSK